MLICLALGDVSLAGNPPNTKTAAPAPPPEWVIRLIEIATGDPMKGGLSSPLSISKSRFDWPWLAQRCGVAPDAAIDPKRFHGPRSLFERLDRNGDGKLDASDFDWSQASPFVQQQAVATALLNRTDTNGDGEVTEKEWQELFHRLAGSRGALTSEDMRRALFNGPGQMTVNRPSRLMRLFGFLSGELGSFREGPNPGAPAPEFDLRAQDGKRRIRLSEFCGRKPVVLVFGSFT
jgi:hypothetical protein